MAVSLPHNMTGTYVLIFYLKKAEEKSIGSLGNILFKKGIYAYVGSAMGKNGIYNRVGRHIRENKKIRWHVDYLQLPVREVWISEPGCKAECSWANLLSTLSGSLVKNFGASDCKCCSHLFYFPSFDALKKAKALFCEKQGLSFQKTNFNFNINAAEASRQPDVVRLYQTLKTAW